MTRKLHGCIPVVDLFAGPGGLGEGFGTFDDGRGNRPFRIALSIEKDPVAHRTLLLRSFYRQFDRDRVPQEYYERLQGRLTTDQVFSLYPGATEAANEEAWRATLGDDSEAPLSLLRSRISRALGNSDVSIFIGGPPCQAYSLIGRSRNKGIDGYALDNDPKAKLYLEYLQLIADFQPAVFVMENVKGLLSSKINGEHIFEQICFDLEDPSAAIRRHGRTRRNRPRHTYRLRALTAGGLFNQPSDFLIRSEQFGVPQARHRIILVGVRDDLDPAKLPLLVPSIAPGVGEMLADLPSVRSGLSHDNDSAAAWTDAVLEVCKPRAIREFGATIDESTRARLASLPEYADEMLNLTRGSEFVAGRAYLPAKIGEWFVDGRLQGFCNHATRGHIRADLHRYAFAAAFADINRRSPELSEFPESLLPEHQNVAKAMSGSHFADRFRVQHRYRYSTTVTSHISKDGHYYIHYDAKQCRSLTGC